MIKLLQITPYGTRTLGGVGQVAYHVARLLGERESVHTTWVGYGEGPGDMTNVEYVEMHPLFRWGKRAFLAYEFWSLSSMRTLWKLVRESDMVQFHDGVHVGCFVAFCMARALGIPTVFTEHVGKTRPGLTRWLPNIPIQWMRRFMVRTATGVVYVARHLQEQDSSLGRRSNVILSGVDPSIFRSDGNARAKRERPLLLFAGRFAYQKRLDIIRGIAQKHPEWDWLLIGEGPARPDLWNLPNVRVLPRCSRQELAEHYRSADLLALPTFGEGIPLTALEALSCGLPMAVSSIARIDDHLPAEACISISDNWSTPVSVEQWSIALQKLLTPEKQSEMRSYLRSHPLNLTWEKTAEQYGSLYGSLMK